MVGTGRFELPTPRTPSECSTRLSHVPTWKDSAVTSRCSGGVRSDSTPIQRENRRVLGPFASPSAARTRRPPLHEQCASRRSEQIIGWRFPAERFTPGPASSCLRPSPPGAGRPGDALSPCAPGLATSLHRSRIRELRRPVRRAPARSCAI